MKRIKPILLIAALTIFVLWQADYIGVICYNDGGMVFRLWLFGAQITLIDQPAAARRAAQQE